MERALEPAGLAFVRALRVSWYNAEVEPAWRLPDFGRGGALGLLVANGAEMWPRFLSGARDSDPDPLEGWLARTIGAAAEAAIPANRRRDLFFAPEPPPRRVALQRLAEVAGFSHLSPARLSVHPVRGPWISLRAVIVVDVEGPRERPPPPSRPCADCAHACAAAFEAALAGADPTRDPRAIEDRWRLWLAVRDACPVGREHRFQEDHIEYGYRKDRALLRRAIQGAANGIGMLGAPGIPGMVGGDGDGAKR
jgi:hypothetical protein